MTSSLQTLFIVGATSAIAEAVARRHAARGGRLHLAARNGERLESLARDLKIRGAAEVSWTTFDAADFDSYPALVDGAWQRLGQVDGVLIAHGTLPSQPECENDWQLARDALLVNGLSPMLLAQQIAHRLAAQKNGVLAVISSVAGDRGRQSNYVYGAAKGGLSVFLQGLRNRYFAQGVGVLTVKPGFVDTPMTAAFPKGPLWPSPERVAADILAAMERGQDVLYTPWFWRAIMLVIRSIPERVFKRLSL